MADLLSTFGSIAVTITAAVIMARLYPVQNIPQQPPSDDNDTSNDNQRCYGRFNHPNVLWIDKVISCLAALALGLNGDVTRESIGRVRKRVTFIETICYHVLCGLLDCIGFWRRLKTDGKRVRYVSSSKWVRGTVLVRRNSNILSKWGIDTNDGNRTEDDQDGGGGDDDDDGDVRVSITCPPSAILWDHVHNNNQSNDFKDKQQQLLPPGLYLNDLPLSPSAHILFWFHGGAFVLGSPTDFFSMHAVREVMGLQEEALREKTTEEEDTYEDMSNNNNDDDRAAPIVLLSVDYRLAPENPFPAAVIDCLSVVSLVLGRDDENASSGGKSSKSCVDTERRTVSSLSSWPPSVHIGGISAGGNLACVVVFECLRRFVGKKVFKSALIIDPFLDPRTKTPSYFHNAKTSVISTFFLRSSWRAYLGNNNRYHDTIRERVEGGTPTCTIRTTTTTVDVPVPVLTVDDSNNKQQHQSKKGVKDNGIIRLYCPQLELPPNVGDENEAPLFIIHTDMGDPLRDEGIALVKSLRSGVGRRNEGNVVHLEARGSHVGGFLLDGEIRKKLMRLWHGAIYGKG